jgi:hypothetical protein
LAKKGKIKVEKTTVFALIVGLLFGNIFNQLFFDFQNNLFFLTSDIFNYLNYLSGNLFFLFFPALAAFLFVELREKKTNSSFGTDMLPLSVRLTYLIATNDKRIQSYSVDSKNKEG